jgi:hypothetical protein
MTIISMPKGSLLHTYRVKKTMSTVTTFEATNQVIPSLPVESRASTFRASKSIRSIQSRHLSPPNETIVAPSLNVSIPCIDK